MPAPTATLSHLHRADGSATYSSHGYTVIAAVNGPLEVQRRDEIADEAAIEVNIRPAVGVSTTRERRLESIVHATLKHIILTKNFPRTLIQVTLQVLSTPEGAKCAFHPGSSLPLLPSLLQASHLALLSASLPLSKTLTSTLIAHNPRTTPTLLSPTKPHDYSAATSLHVFAFSHPSKDLLLAESEGDFSISTWDAAYAAAEEICCGGAGDAGEESDEEGRMDVDGGVKLHNDEGLRGWVKRVAEEKVRRDQRWREAE